MLTTVTRWPLNHQVQSCSGPISVLCRLSIEKYPLLKPTHKLTCQKEPSSMHQRHWRQAILSFLAHHLHPHVTCSKASRQNVAMCMSLGAIKGRSGERARIHVSSCTCKRLTIKLEEHLNAYPHCLRSCTRLPIELVLTQLHDEAILLQHHLVYVIWQMLQEGQVSHLDMPQVIAPSV